MNAIRRSLIALQRQAAGVSATAGRALLASLALLACANALAQGTPLNLSPTPLITTASSTVKPNLMFVLDNSASMAWDYMPDHVNTIVATSGRDEDRTGMCRGMSGSTVVWNRHCCQRTTGVMWLTAGNDNNASNPDRACYLDANRRMQPPLQVADINHVAYDPKVRYLPPKQADGTDMPSMTAATTTGWTAVPRDGFNQGELSYHSATVNLLTQYPDTAWCVSSSATETDCLRNGNYLLPGTVDGKQYVHMRLVAATGTGRLAVGTPGAVNTLSRTFGPHYYTITPEEWCTNNTLRDCVNSSTATTTHTVPAYLRWCSSDANALASDPAAGSCQSTHTPVYRFARYPAKTARTTGTIGGFVRTDIVPGVALGTKADNRQDCAAAQCTYEEEMTNFANWFAYYRTRMQAMKSAVTLAFDDINDRIRVGFYTINQDGGDFLNLATFDSTAKTNWFSALTSSSPAGGTPLKTALSRMGEMYGRKETSIYGKSVTDPVQYSCQRNYTLLSTDGFTNETSADPKTLTGADIGDRDGVTGTPRPILDGLRVQDTLSDIAYYYYQTDIRTSALNNCTSNSSGSSLNVCENNVNKNVTSKPQYQHMITFTLSLGVSGQMQFADDYNTRTERKNDDYDAVLHGSMAASGVCTWQTVGECNWPPFVNNTLTAVDDLWHAAISGGGLYFNANDADAVVTGIKAALDLVDKDDAAAAAATTSNPNLTQGDNSVFASSYVAGNWSGDIVKKTVILADDPKTETVNEAGSISNQVVWSAAARLDSRNLASNPRKIYIKQDGASSLADFVWDDTGATGLSLAQKAHFSQASIGSGTNRLSQYCSTGTTCLNTAEQASAAGKNLVDFLRGDRTREVAFGTQKSLYRERNSRLGDIVGSEAVYVQKPLFSFVDDGYAQFKIDQANRKPAVYVGANDGMLHAFDGNTGDELWAFIPTELLPRLYRLADKNYKLNRQTYVDGSPVVADIKIGNVWKTILVGGLGAGGRSYYALDITNPAAPVFLWEFSDANLGLTFGKSEIVKLVDGTWAVIFGSGYNNSGTPRLYVLNAATGAMIYNIPAVDAANAGPDANGLAHIRAWVDRAEVNNTSSRVYAGDNGGNVWRFTLGASSGSVIRLATLRDATETAQPVTARPELGSVGGVAMVYLGTGRYLQQSDLGDTQRQTVYGIRDPLTSTGWGDGRRRGTLVAQTLNNTNPRAGAAINPVDLNTRAGWYADLPFSTERSTNAPQLVAGLLFVTSNVIGSTACDPAATSYLNVFDYATGGVRISDLLAGSFALAPTVAGLPADGNSGGSGAGGGVPCTGANCPPPAPSGCDGQGQLLVITQLGDGTQDTRKITAPGLCTTRRVSWRELATEQ